MLLQSMPLPKISRSDFKRKKSRGHERFAPYCTYSWAIGNAHKSSKTDGSRPTRSSLKCNCGWYINSSIPIGKNYVQIVGVNLDHTNGCLGDDSMLNFVINTLSGRKYPQYALDQLRGEVK